MLQFPDVFFLAVAAIIIIIIKQNQQQNKRSDIFAGIADREPELGYEVRLPGHKPVYHPFQRKQIHSITLKHVFHSATNPQLLQLVCRETLYSVRTYSFFVFELTLTAVVMGGDGW